MRIPRLQILTFINRTQQQTSNKNEMSANNDNTCTLYCRRDLIKYQNGTEKTSAKTAFIAPTPKRERFTYTETQMDMDGR